LKEGNVLYKDVYELSDIYLVECKVCDKEIGFKNNHELKRHLVTGSHKHFAKMKNLTDVFEKFVDSEQL